MSLATFLVTLCISFLEHLHPHKYIYIYIYIYNAQTFMIMSKHKHIYMVNFDKKIQRRRMKQGQIPDLKFCKTYVCQEN